MTFQLLPVIDRVLELYRMPLSPVRFEQYLKLLHDTTKSELVLPIGGFNPMAKEHALEQLEKLKAFDAEAIVAALLPALNKATMADLPDTTISISVNLSDDVKGGWTNRYTSDYDSKFKINALLSRHFCTPIFWTSEIFSTTMIRQRILEYTWRTVYRQHHPAPKTLKDHLDQEMFVARQAPLSPPVNPDLITTTGQVYREHMNSEDYHVIFNFFYGSDASASLSFPLHFDIPDMAGFRYATYLASHS